MRVLDISISLIAAASLLAIAVKMVRRKLQREYGFFFVYVLFSLFTAVSSSIISGNYWIYFYFYWITAASNTVLALLALNEAFYSVFYRFYSFWWFRLIFPSVFSVIFLIAVRRALLKPFSPAPLFMWVVLSVESAFSLIPAGIAIAFLLLALYLRVRLSQYPFHIALGFAIVSFGDVMEYGLFSQFGTKHNHIFRYLPAAMYLCGTLIWLGSLSKRFEPHTVQEFRKPVHPRRYSDQSSTPKLEKA